jgi:hypothetical protein
MGRRRIEMFQYRQVLVRLRAGDSVREIARSGLMGRDKLGMLRAVAEQSGWLDAGIEVPGDEAIAAALGQGRRVVRAGQRVTVSDHLPPEARNFFERDRRWCATQAQAIGPRCVELVDRLLGDRIAERLRAAQGVLSMGKRYGAARLEAACERALAHNSPHYRTVKTILSTGADQQPLIDVQTPAAYARARFTRSAADLFSAEPTTLH